MTPSRGRSATGEAADRTGVLARVWASMWIYAFGVLGLFLMTVPWTLVWDHVTFALLPAPAARWVASGWVRGGVSGLGILNLLSAAKDAAAWWRETR